MIDRFLSTLGLARKAGRLSWGIETVSSAVGTGKVTAVFTAADLSERSQKTIGEVCRRRGVPCIRTAYGMDLLGDAVGVYTGILAVTDPGLAKTALDALNKTEQGLAEQKDIPLTSKEESQ